MSRYVANCARCGKPFDGGRKKLVMMRERSMAVFGQDGFARYYCDECAEGAKEAIRRFEEGRE